jgi:CRP-like cAMP-binding protein
MKHNDAPDAHAPARSPNGRPSGLPSPTPARENRLLAALSPLAYKRLLPHLKRKYFETGETLHEPYAPVERIYFVLSGVVSLRLFTANGGYIDIALVGNEGVIGIAGILLSNWPLFAAQVLIVGEALEISPQALQSALRRSRRLHDLLLNYTYLLSEQIGQGVACLRYHSNEQRMARHILEIRERVAANPYHLTHAEIATVFGRSRSLITGGAKALKSKGLIDYSPGEIKITDLEGLKAASCECYEAIIQKIYSQATFRS